MSPIPLGIFASSGGVVNANFAIYTATTDEFSGGVYTSDGKWLFVISGGEDDVLIVLTSESGEVLAKKTIVGVNSDGDGVVEDSSGNFWFIGNTAAAGPEFLVKLSSDLTTYHTYQYTGTSITLEQVIAGPADRVIVSGYAASLGALCLTFSVDLSGNVVWAQQYRITTTSSTGARSFGVAYDAANNRVVNLVTLATSTTQSARVFVPMNATTGEDLQARSYSSSIDTREGFFKVRTGGFAFFSPRYENTLLFDSTGTNCTRWAGVAFAPFGGNYLAIRNIEGPFSDRVEVAFATSPTSILPGAGVSNQANLIPRRHVSVNSDGRFVIAYDQRYAIVGDINVLFSGDATVNSEVFDASGRTLAAPTSSDVTMSNRSLTRSTPTLTRTVVGPSSTSDSVLTVETDIF